MEKLMLSPSEICDEVIKSGIKKANSLSIELLILSIFAGIFIALGGFAAAVFSHSIENIGVSKFAAGTVFPVGLMMVIICGGELFTGNALMVIPLYEKKIRLSRLIRNWVIVYFGNFIGAFLISLLIFNSSILDINSGKLGAYAIKAAVNKGSMSFINAFTSGILCNILVCIAVWGAYGAKSITGKILIIWFPIMAFVVSGFEHSVANMYYFSIGMLSKSNLTYVELSKVGEKIANLDFIHVILNLIPVTLGNIIGGSLIIGTGYWLIYKHIPKAK